MQDNDKQNDKQTSGPARSFARLTTTRISVHRTPNTPLKDVLAVCEVRPKWRGVVAKLTEGMPIEEAPNFLQQLGIDRVLTRKSDASKALNQKKAVADISMNPSGVMTSPDNL